MCVRVSLPEMADNNDKNDGEIAWREFDIHKEVGHDDGRFIGNNHRPEDDDDDEESDAENNEFMFDMFKKDEDDDIIEEYKFQNLPIIRLKSKKEYTNSTGLYV